jgi:hypothetical protein
VSLLRKLLAPGVIVLAGLAFFAPVLAGRGFLCWDMLYQYYPYSYFLFSALRKLSLPFWNPYVFSGMPFLGDVQSQVFYPLNWLLALVSSPAQANVYWLLEFKVILHVVMAGVFTYLLGRELKLSRAAAVGSALVFMLSGFMITHVMHMTLVMTLAWFPLLALLLLRLLRTRTLRDALWLALALGAANLASHPQITLQMLYALALLGVLYVAFNWPGERQWLFTRHLPLLLAALVLGFGLSLVSLLPAWEHSRLTLREAVSFADSADGSLPWSFPLLLLVPKFFGSIAGNATETVRYWGSASRFHYWETSAYFGILPLVMAVFGLFFSRARTRLWFLVLGLLALLAALGRNGPFYWLMFKFLPGFDRFRIPARFMATFALCGAVLAGFGLEAFVNTDTGERGFRRFRYGLSAAFAAAVLGWVLMMAGVFRGITSGPDAGQLYANASNQTGLLVLFVGLAAGLFWLRGSHKRPATSHKHLAAPSWPAIAAIVLMLIDLFVFGFRFNLGSQNPDKYYDASGVVARLKQERANTMFRINARQGNQTLFELNGGMIHELELMEGFTPLAIADYSTFTLSPERKRDLLNARYYVEVVNAEKGQMGLRTNPQAMPRAWIAYDWQVEPEHKRVLERLEQIDYRNTVVVEQEPGIARAPDTLPADSAVVTSWRPDEIRIRAVAARPGILVLSEVFYPKWRAAVDGKPVPVLKTDYCLRGVALTAGSHEVVFRYDAATVGLGGVASLVSLLVVVVLLVAIPRFGRAGRQTGIEQSKGRS